MSTLKKIFLLFMLIPFILALSSCKTSNDYSNVYTSSSEKKEQITIPSIETKGISVNFRASGKYLYAKKGSQWSAVFLKGVNMGLTQPLTNLDNPNVSYDTYIRWFEQIGEMNANTVKVFTIMNPNFYKAFYDYNNSHPDSPLYLIQGIWFNENYMYDIGDALDEDKTVITAFKRAVTETVDIIHGNSFDTQYGEFNPAEYPYDISEYLVGYVLGLEWYPDFVINTNKNHKGYTYKGKYLSTKESASPFEAFLAQVGDKLISYETEKYKSQAPVAFLNWSTTDSIKHTNEPFPEEDAVSVDTENIVSSDLYYPGMFAAVDVYPYYPEFLNYQPEYLSYTDENGPNPFRAYLRDLSSKYSVPLLIAEFGLPTSRGIAHKSVMGYNQGGIEESLQGTYICRMMGDIFKENCAGGIIFSWQDEWFKQTWNTIKFSPANPARRTVNIQSAEQHYGILSYEPSLAEDILINGDFSDWEGKSPVASKDGYTLYADYDEGYLYLYIKSSFDPIAGGKRLIIPIKTIGLGNSSSSEYGLSFSEPAEFLLVLDGRLNSRLKVAAYYDSFHYIYSVQKKVFEENKKYSVKNSGIFNSVYMFLSNEIVLPLSGETFPPVKYESGALSYGNADPSSEDFNSLADFCASNKGVEIRIPWYNLNVVNSADKKAVSDFYKNKKIDFAVIDDIKIGIATDSKEKNIKLYSINYTGIEKPSYRERLKKSYDIIKAYLKNISL